jgi:hypothetical protein
MPGTLEDLLSLSQGGPRSLGRTGGSKPTGLPPELLQLLSTVLGNNKARDPNLLANQALAASAKPARGSDTDLRRLRNRPVLTNDMQVRVPQPIQAVGSPLNTLDALSGGPSSPAGGGSLQSMGDNQPFNPDFRPEGGTGEFGARRSTSDQRPDVEEGLEGFLELSEPIKAVPGTGSEFGKFQEDPAQEDLQGFRGDIGDSQRSMSDLESTFNELLGLIRREQESVLTETEKQRKAFLEKAAFGGGRPSDADLRAEGLVR